MVCVENDASVISSHGAIDLIGGAKITAPPSPIPPGANVPPRPYSTDETITDADELDNTRSRSRPKEKFALFQKVVIFDSVFCSLLQSSDSYTFGIISEWGIYGMHRDNAMLAVDDLTLFAGGGGTKIKFNPKKQAEMVCGFSLLCRAANHSMCHQ